MGFRDINAFARQTPWLHGIAKLYANDGVVLFGLLLLLGLWFNRRSWTAASRSLLAGAGVLLAVAINQPVVHAVAEPRPYTRWHDTLLLVHRSTDASFPSDHATMAGAVAAGLVLSHRRLGLLAVPLALLMALDRVYVGAHYPVDVVAGLVYGANVAAAVQLLDTRVAQYAPALLATAKRVFQRIWTSRATDQFST